MSEAPLIRPHPFVKYPLKRLMFITIKDNTQKSKWTSIGKVNDWIRRYSTTYYIVRGTQGGSHFHLLAGVKPNVTFRFQKGIHFYVKDLASKSVYSREDAEQARAGRDLAEYIRDEKFTYCAYDLEVEQQNCLKQLCAEIRLYFKRKRDKIKRVEYKDSKHKKIQCVLDYLQKNLDEEREDQIDQYKDYINNT